jgi:hypothetical protein
MSCHTVGSDMDCILCIMSSSKGNEGWNSSPIREGTLDGSDNAAPILGANGSMPPTGANWSNESAASVGSGDSELLVVGEGKSCTKLLSKGVL